MVKLFYKDKPVIGLDISQAGVKLMAVDTNRMTVMGYASMDLPPSKLQTAFESAENPFLTDSITSLLDQHLIGNLPSNHTVIALPTARTFSRTFTLPIDQEQNIKGAVDVEVNQYIPVPSASLYVDYEVIDRNDKEFTIVMAAIPKNLVNNCVAAATNAGLRPVMVEPGINAVARILQSTENGELSTLILDIGQTSTDIAILDKGTVRISGSAPVGGHAFTIAIAEKLKVTPENAHQLKILNGLNAGQRRSKIEMAMKPHLQQIISEANKVMRYYSERMGQEKKIEQILIVGSGSDVPGIGEYFTNAFVMPARTANPWQDLKFHNLPQPNRQFRPRYITVAGLAVTPMEAVRK